MSGVDILNSQHESRENSSFWLCFPQNLATAGCHADDDDPELQAPYQSLVLQIKIEVSNKHYEQKLSSHIQCKAEIFCLTDEEPYNSVVQESFIKSTKQHRTRKCEAHREPDDCVTNHTNSGEEHSKRGQYPGD
jgi:hypothetical protein